MKQDYIENQAKIQIQQSIKDALSGSSQTTKQERCKYAMPHSPLLGRGRGEAFVRGFGKGPPGRSRSPGITDHLFPEHPPDHCTANETHLKTNLKPILNSITVRQCAEIHLNTEYQIVIKTQLLQPFKFFIMKKQILFIAFLVLAVFANVNKSYGQVCTPDRNHPAPGVAYDYQVTVSGTTGGTVPVYTWYVTQGVNLLTAAQITAGTDYTINSGAGTSTINITWTAASLANGNPYYLVVKYSETSTIGCAVENMKVYEIEPINTFLLAVAGSDLAGVVANDETCPPAVDGAIVTPGASVAYTYGQTTIYYKVTASGIVGTWTPSIQLPALGSLSQNYNAADWTDDGGTTWNTFGLADGDVAGGSYTSTATDAPATVAGSDIIVRIKIDNVNFESLAAQPIEMGVDGVLPGGNKDIVSTTVCTDEVDFGKKGTHTITPRPTITDTLPAFLPKAP